MMGSFSLLVGAFLTLFVNGGIAAGADVGGRAVGVFDDLHNG
jgi:hypothetical protein